MSDIDFDELDKAVNSLMNKRQDQADESASNLSQPSDPVSFSENSQDSRQDDPIAIVDNNEKFDTSEKASSVPASAPAAPSPNIRRSTGRFMDVVLPASAGRADDLSSKRMRPRDTTSLEPVNDLPSTEPVTNQHAEKVVEASSFGQSFSEQPSSDLNTSPMQSPFLSDVEVNKRPLGLSDEGKGLADGVAAALEPRDDNFKTAPSFYEDMEKSDIDMEAASMDSAVFGADFSAVNDETPTPYQHHEAESSMNQTESTVPESNVEGTPEADLGQGTSEEFNVFNRDEELSTEFSEDKPAEAIDEANQQDADMLAEDSVTEPEEASKPEPTTVDRPTLGPAQQPGDILPQYTPEATDAPEPSSVFEAASESPKELDHPEKVRSGWMVLVWIVILIILGAAGGVGAWYFLIK